MKKKRLRPLILGRALESCATLGPKLAQVRAERDLSLRRVARLTDYGVDPSNLSRIESGGRQDPRISTLLVLCVAYGIDVTLTRDGEIKLKEAPQ